MHTELHTAMNINNNNVDIEKIVRLLKENSSLITEKDEITGKTPLDLMAKLDSKTVTAIAKEYGYHEFIKLLTQFSEDTATLDAISTIKEMLSAKKSRIEAAQQVSTPWTTTEISLDPLSNKDLFDPTVSLSYDSNDIKGLKEQINKAIQSGARQKLHLNIFHPNASKLKQIKDMLPPNLISTLSFATSPTTQDFNKSLWQNLKQIIQQQQTLQELSIDSPYSFNELLQYLPRQFEKHKLDWKLNLVWKVRDVVNTINNITTKDFPEFLQKLTIKFFHPTITPTSSSARAQADFLTTLMQTLKNSLCKLEELTVETVILNADFFQYLPITLQKLALPNLRQIAKETIALQINLPKLKELNLHSSAVSSLPILGTINSLTINFPIINGIDAMQMDVIRPAAKLKEILAQITAVIEQLFAGLTTFTDLTSLKFTGTAARFEDINIGNMVTAASFENTCMPLLWKTFSDFIAVLKKNINLEQFEKFNIEYFLLRNTEITEKDRTTLQALGKHLKSIHLTCTFENYSAILDALIPSFSSKESYSLQEITLNLPYIGGSSQNQLKTERIEFLKTANSIMSRQRIIINYTGGIQESRLSFYKDPEYIKESRIYHNLVTINRQYFKLSSGTGADLIAVHSKQPPSLKYECFRFFAPKITAEKPNLNAFISPKNPVLVPAEVEEQFNEYNANSYLFERYTVSAFLK